MSETVLLYNFSGSEAGRKLKPILLKMRIRIRIVEPENYLLPIGALVGHPVAGESSDIRKNISGSASSIPELMMVLQGFTSKRLDLLLREMRNHGMPPVLKAIVTSSNQNWNSLTLYNELKKERDAMENPSS